MLQVNYNAENFSYIEDITELDAETIIKARKIVADYIERGILTNKSFNDDTWIIDNQNQIRTIVFPQMTSALDTYCNKYFKFSASMFVALAKTYLTLNFGASAILLQATATEIRRFAECLTGNESTEALKTTGANHLADFISLLPETAELDNIQEELEAYVRESYQQAGEQRILAQFRSYLIFDKVIAEFFESASEAEKIMYFPVWFWWKVSTLIPLRPTELVLTPRLCFTKDSQLIIRRTKMKKRKNSSEYRLDLDYSKHTYRVPDDIINETHWYIEATADDYTSDIDTLFSLGKDKVKATTDRLNSHVTYGDLNILLKRFYCAVVSKKLHYEIVDFSGVSVCELGDKQIEAITLGDTRHLAMVSIFLTTKNPEMCRELAGHDDINISSHYYTNMQNFIKAISFERIRTQGSIYVPQSKSTGLTPLNRRPVNGGFCLSENLAKGDYTDCMRAVSTDGHLFDCSQCKYFVSTTQTALFEAKELSQNEALDKDFKEAFDFLIYTINQVRKHLGFEEDIQSAFLKMQAAAEQYKNKLVRQFVMEECNG